MIKKMMVGLFMALIVLATFKETTIYVFFKLNQDFIARNLCVEREIEESTCNGCCQLEKKINETRNNETTSTKEQQQRTYVPILLCVNTLAVDRGLNFARNIMSLSNRIVELYSYNFTSVCFHPPKHLIVFFF